MKNLTICALALSASTFLNCAVTVETLEIPKECYKVTSMSQGIMIWEMTCDTKEGKSIYFNRGKAQDGWNRYDLEKSK